MSQLALSDNSCLLNHLVSVAENLGPELESEQLTGKVAGKQSREYTRRGAGTRKGEANHANILERPRK
jgi:hypothetical protein